MLEYVIFVFVLPSFAFCLLPVYALHHGYITTEVFCALFVELIILLVTTFAIIRWASHTDLKSCTSKIGIESLEFDLDGNMDNYV